MLKMSARVAALFVAGLISLACSSSGLKSGGGTAGSGGGGQAGSTISSGTAGGTGGAIGTGTAGGATTIGASSGPPGTIATGGALAGGTRGVGSGTGGTSGCAPIACPALACASGTRPNPDSCGCPICASTPDAGVARDARGADSLPVCLPPKCAMPANCSEYQPNPDPCGCPICVPTPDAGSAKDAGSPDGPICLGPPPPCALPPKTCPAGSQLVSPPCGCTGCVPVDGGAGVDAGKADAPLVCNVMCPNLACVGGYLESPEPCACPICAPNPDSGGAGGTDAAGGTCQLKGYCRDPSGAMIPGCESGCGGIDSVGCPSSDLACLWSKPSMWNDGAIQYCVAAAAVKCTTPADCACLPGDCAQWGGLASFKWTCIGGVCAVSCLP
jgi:hypothetical protein